jgi:hypothetical protein
LQARLDDAWAAHPDRPTLGDFRAPQSIVDAEAEALAYASQIVTPHDEIAQLFRDRVFKLDWQMPAVPPSTGSVLPRRIAFPGPTVARKGAYEVREAALALGLEVVLAGSELEGPGFWNGVGTRRPDPAAGSAGWLNGVAAVVQPALVEDRPRHLLVALAAGVPVIATAACGLGRRNGLTIIPEDDATALIAALVAAPPSPERDTVAS